MNIDQLRLSPLTKQAALFILDKHPYVIFTSGRRSMEAQARVMASNIYRNREWVKQTYTRKGRPSYEVATRLQDLLYKRSEIKDMGGLMTLILTSFQGWPDWSEISFHTAGRAFDVKPILDNDYIPTAEGRTVLDSLRRLPGGDTGMPLQKEGGQIIWHWQLSPLIHESVEV